jgi:hypothetical protein
MRILQEFMKKSTFTLNLQAAAAAAAAAALATQRM